MVPFAVEFDSGSVECPHLLVGQLLAFAFPQPNARTIAGVAVRGDQQRGRIRVALAANFVSPEVNALHDDGSRLMVYAATGSSRTGSQIADAVRYCPAQVLDQEVVYPGLFRIAGRPPCPAGILEAVD